MLNPSAGPPFSLASAPLETSSTIVPTTARPRIHPARNAGPLTRPRGVASISTTAMIGIGLSATPTPNARTCPIAWPIVRSALDLAASDRSPRDVRRGRDRSWAGDEGGVTHDALGPGSGSTRVMSPSFQLRSK